MIMKLLHKLRLAIPALFLVCTMILPSLALTPETADPLALEAVSAILIEARTGQVLYEKNADERLPPASVTKIMTILLVMEAIDSAKITLTDMVSVSEDAASMGGSQVYLKVGEQMSVEDMLKSVIIASANDCAYALAEFISGSEDAFVARMNERAAELGMTNTVFENTNGLDDATVNHMTTARDISLMSAELIVKHPTVLTYSSIWMDSIRDGAFGLTNTNRLIRFYSGANGLKTGSTSKAKFCISATAKRDDMQLIAVIMASPTRDMRNEAAKKLLDWGFAKYSFFVSESGMCGDVRVLGGISDIVPTVTGEFTAVVGKGDEKKIERNIVLPEDVAAPVRAGDVVGEVEYLLGGEIIGKCDILASEEVGKISYFGIFEKLIKKFLLI